MDKALVEELLELHDNEELLVVDDGDWIDDGKYSHRTVVVAYYKKFYAIDENRSGSYYTDYEYGEPSVYEVEAVQKTITTWEAKKESV
jgi:hypothetical protein